VAERVRPRRLSDVEGQQLQQIVRRGNTARSGFAVRRSLWRRRVGPQFQRSRRLVQADEDTVRQVIHRFNEIGLACLDPQLVRVLLVVVDMGRTVPWCTSVVRAY
jgi:hypothetical protein